MKRALFLLAILLPATFTLPVFAQKSLAPPAFKPGDTLFYRVYLKINRDISTVSALSLPQTPSQASLDVQSIVQVEVLPSDAGSSAGSVRFRTWFLTLASDFGTPSGGAKPGGANVQRFAAESTSIDCTLTPDGEIAQITGLDGLASEQQQAWREWAARFSAAFLIAAEKRKRGAKWSSEEPETTPSPIADLRWQKKSQYVHDEPCTPLKFARSGEFLRAAGPDTCAAIISTATLLQKSSPKDSTPPGYKQRNLRTSGAAGGANDVLLSISRKTGRLIRATENATQKMDALIALADGSTHVRYSITATAVSSVELVTDLPLILQPKSSK